MNATARKKDRDPDRPSLFFSCAFCSTESEKPFKICESCGSQQPEPVEEK